MNPDRGTLGGEPSIAHEDTSGLVKSAGDLYVQAIPVPAVETGGWKATVTREVGRYAEKASCGEGERGGPIDQGQADEEHTCSIETTNDNSFASRKSADGEASEGGTEEAGNDGPPTNDDLPPVRPPPYDGLPADPDGNSRWPPERPEDDTRPPLRAEAIMMKEVGRSTEEASCGNGERGGQIDLGQANGKPTGSIETTNDIIITSRRNAVDKASKEGTGGASNDGPPTNDGPPIDDPEQNADYDGNARRPLTSPECDARPTPNDLLPVWPSTNDEPPADPDGNSRLPPESSKCDTRSPSPKSGEACDDGPPTDDPPTPDDLPPVWPPTSDGPLTNDPDGNSRRPPESPNGDTRLPPPHSGEAGSDWPPIDDPKRDANPDNYSRWPPMSPEGDALPMPDDLPPDLPPPNNGPPADSEGNPRRPPDLPSVLPPTNDEPPADPDGNSRLPPESSKGDTRSPSPKSGEACDDWPLTDDPLTPDDLPPVWPPTSDGPLTNDPDGNSRRPPESPNGDTRLPPLHSGEAGNDWPPIDDPKRDANPDNYSRWQPMSPKGDALPMPDDLPPDLPPPHNGLPTDSDSNPRRPPDLPSVLPPTNDGPPADPDGISRRPPGIPQGDARPPPRAEANMRKVGHFVGEESCGKGEQGDPINQGQADGEFTGSFETTNGDEDVQTIPVPCVETAGTEASVETVQMLQRKSPGNPPPGEGWIPKRAEVSKRKFKFHWISPTRQIEFRGHTPACNFEKLRREYDNDEVRAWGEYRKLGRTYVVSPELYDQPGTIPHKKASSRSPEKLSCPWRLSERMALRAGTKGTRGSGADGQKSIKKRVVRRTRVSGKTRVSILNQKKRGRQKPTTIDQKWAQSLVGLRLKVPGIWWNNCTDKVFYTGRISKINFSDKFKRYFILKMDTGESYPMRYDAVRMYADKDLPVKPPGAEAQSASRLLDGGGLLEVDRQEKEQSTVEADDGDGLAVRHAQAQLASILKNPGPDWTSKCVDYGWQFRFHWVSPVRRIEFKKHTAACQFEDLRKKHKNDEVKAWNEYRSNGGQTHVVAPHQYDLPEEPCVVPNAAGPSKRKRRDTSGLAVPKAKMSKKTTHEVAAQLPKASIKSKSKSSTAIKSYENRLSSLDPSLRVEDILYEHPLISSPEPNFDDGLNSNDVKIVCLKQMRKRSFFEYYFRGRTHRVVKSLNDDEPPEKMITFRGKKYWLASAEVDRDIGVGFMRFAQTKTIELMYINKLGLQNELDKLGCFGKLKPEKVITRLEKLKSEVQSIVTIKASTIEIIEEEGHEGCGFCPEQFFQILKAKKGSDSIQVRIIGPTIGFAKGMLLKKRGITCIQLPRSMIKVPPSETCTDNFAVVLINNSFPSEGNSLLGRFLDPCLTTTNGWINDHRKPLSDMYRRMLIGYGVKKSDVDKYITRASSKPENLKHTHLKGCIDPTGCLPQKTVFIAGYTRDNNNKRALFGKVHPKVYLSRSPSLEPTDAKLVPVISSKPKEMSGDDWNMLCSYQFGTIIFPQSKDESTPLPNVIADGDLDGDDYFVMWHEDILKSLINNEDEFTSNARRQLFKLELPAGIEKGVVKETKFAKTSDSKWLSKAQDKMLDFPQQNAATNLVGKLWTLCNKASERSGGAVDLCDKDAVAYAKAYKESMDIQKHGGRINLPQRLHENLPKSLRYLLASEYESRRT